MRTVDMQDPKNRDTALELARAASDTEGWGEMRAADCQKLAEPDAMLWTAYKDKDHPEGVSVVAITGKGFKTYTVSGGSITLDTAATAVYAGLPYDADWKTAKLAVGYTLPFLCYKATA